MRSLVLLPYYFQWHYGQALKNIGAITKNFLWFFWHFFSIGLLIQTLFMPWQKIHEDRPSGIDLGPILGTLIINVLMRIAGALIRLFMIVIGLVTLAATFCGAVLFFLLWLALPVCIVFSFLIGVIIVFRHS